MTAIASALSCGGHVGVQALYHRASIRIAPREIFSGSSNAAMIFRARDLFSGGVTIALRE